MMQHFVQDVAMRKRRTWSRDPDGFMPEASPDPIGMWFAGLIDRIDDWLTDRREVRESRRACMEPEPGVTQVLGRR